MALFTRNNEINDKVSFTVNAKRDRNDQFRDIFEALVTGFARVFDTKELYSMRVDISFNKNRERMDKKEVEEVVGLDNVDVND